LIIIKDINKINTSQRRPVSCNLPMYVLDKTTRRIVTPPRPDHDCALSKAHGVTRRYGTKPPPRTPGIRRKLTRFVQLWCRRNLKPLESVPKFEDWILDAPYSAARKEELVRVWDDCGRRPQWKKWRTIKSFVKDETYEIYKAWRLINSRVDSAKCFYGPIVAAMSKQIFSLKWFVKNIPVAGRPLALSRIQRPGATYYYTDYTSYEAHFTSEAMAIFQQVMVKYMIQNLPARYQRAQMKFQTDILAGRSICLFKDMMVKVDATRMSGEMDTSLSNGFANLMLFLFACKQRGIKDEHIQGFVEGDDGLFSILVDNPPTKEDFEEYGFSIKIGGTKLFNEASFCGQVYDIDDMCVITDITDALARVGWSNKRYVMASEKTRLQLLRARGFSLAYQYNGCPVLGALGRRILWLTRHVEIEQRIVDSMDWWDKEKYLQALNLPEFRIPGLSTRNLVDKLYGVSVHQQLLWEAEIGVAELGPLCLSSFPEKLVWQDYVDKYCTGQLDPVWIRRDHSKLMFEMMTKLKDQLRVVSKMPKVVQRPIPHV
jgi:hypothetical protein